MHILEVIPITKSVDTDTLSYFSAKDVDLGSLVTVPLRKKEVMALVVSKTAVLDLKSQVRGASYQLRNILRVHDGQVLSPAFLRTAGYLARYYAAAPGRVISQITPAFVIDKLDNWDKVPVNQAGTGYQELILGRDYQDRVTYYKTLLREHLIEKSSLHILCPTIKEVEVLSAELSKNNRNVFVLHSGLTKTALKKIYQALHGLGTLSLIISTPQFIDTYQVNKKTVVIEADDSRYYESVSEPYIDGRILARIYAQKLGITLISAASVTRIETYARYQDGEADLAGPLHKRIFKPGEVVLVTENRQVGKKTDAERIKVLEKKSKTFTTISTEARDVITTSLKNKESVFLFVHRKSLAPSIVCEDCGNIARSPSSGLPYALYTRTNKNTRVRERLFICSLTGEVVRAFDHCQFCKGWNLTQLGIGTDRVAEEAERIFDIEPLIIDGEHTKTAKALKQALKKLEAGGPLIVIGTEKALPYLKDVGQSIIVSMDSYFTRMSYQSNEEALSLIKKVSEASERPTILQSRNVTTSLLPIIQTGMYQPYAEAELNARNSYGFPPKITLIVIQRVVPREKTRIESDTLTNLFRHYNPEVLTAPAAKRTMVRVAVILRRDQHWPKGKGDADLVSLLRSLGRGTTIKINPSPIID